MGLGKSIFSSTRQTFSLFQQRIKVALMVRAGFASNLGTVYGGGALHTALLFASNPVPMNNPSLSSAPPQDGGSTDSQLMRQIRECQPAALSRVYDLYSTMVFSVAMRVLHSPVDAEDVMQEVFLKLWQQPNSFAENRGSLCGWLAVVARNRAIDRVRGMKRFEDLDDLQLPNSTNLSSEAEREMLLEKVRKVLDTMPADQRQAVEMAFFDGHTHTEIATKTGQPLGTVKTRIRSALIAIRKALETTA